MANWLPFGGVLGLALVALNTVAAGEVGTQAHPHFVESHSPSDLVPGEPGALRQASFHRVRHAAPLDDCCNEPPWAHRTGLFGELLFLRARDAEVAYALPVNGNVPVGSVGVLDPEFDLGYRVGLTKAFDQCSSLTLAYTGFFSEQSDSVSANAPNSLSKLLVHPNELNAAANVPQASGEYGVDFQTVDLEYRFLALSTECTAANFLIGGRYGHLDQELVAQYTGAGLTETVRSEVEFNGAGIRLGADIEHHRRNGLFCYGKTSANFLAGEFNADYLHSSTVDPVRVRTDWEAGRVVSLLDLEIGAGWQCSRRCRISAGYTISSWFGAMDTDNWINAVQSDDYRDMDDNVTFDGFVTRIEYRF